MTGEPGPPIEVTDNVAGRRYELRVDGTLVGLLDYEERSPVRVLAHAEVDPAHRGAGLATTLLEGVFADVDARDLTIVPLCPFVVDYVEKHPETVRYIDEEHRSRFR